MKAYVYIFVFVCPSRCSALKSTAFCLLFKSKQHIPSLKRPGSEEALLAAGQKCINALDDRHVLMNVSVVVWEVFQNDQVAEVVLRAGVNVARNEGDSLRFDY